MNLGSLRKELESRQVFKAWEIEENLDRYFFRPVAVVFTAVFLPLRITPDAVSVAGMLLGMASAIFLFGPSVPALALAVTLLWLSEILDAADGQLARMQKEPSRYGRIVDGVCSMLMYLVVYYAVGWGLLARTGDWTWPALAMLAVLSHSLQSALYDFFRGEYIRIVKKREAADPDAPEALADAQRRTGTAPTGLLRGLALALYRHYAMRQVWTTPTYQPLLRAIEACFRDRPVSERFAKVYGEEQRKMVRWWNYLGPNVHLLMLTVAILLRDPALFLWGNVVLLNVYGLVLTWIQHSTTQRLLRELSQEPAPQPSPVTGRALAEV